MKAKLVKREDGLYFLNDENGNLIYGKLSLKNCQAIERGYNLDELADFYSTMTVFIKKDEIPTEKQIEDAEYISEIAFKAGFKKALELMGDKKFSEDDVMLGWDAGIMSKSIVDNNWTSLIRSKKLLEHRESYKTNLKPISLQQTEWDVEIEMELNLNGKNAIERSEYVPNIDADGCLILKRI